MNNFIHIGSWAPLHIRDLTTSFPSIYLEINNRPSRQDSSRRISMRVKEFKSYLSKLKSNNILLFDQQVYPPKKHVFFHDWKGELNFFFASITTLLWSFPRIPLVKHFHYEKVLDVRIYITLTHIRFPSSCNTLYNDWSCYSTILDKSQINHCDCIFVHLFLWLGIMIS